MYRATIEISRINKMMKLKFGLIIKSDDIGKYKSNQLLNKFSYGGNDYLRLNPNPFIILDISSYMTKGESWSTNHSVTLNRYYLFRFLQGLRKFIQDFQSRKNLFYYQNNELVINNTIADMITVSVPTANSKTIMLKPCIVPDEESSTDKVYEGCIFYINSMDNFAYLTYTEMEYLYYELSKVDMSSLSLHLIEIVKQFENQKAEKITVPASTQEEVPAEIEMVTPSTVTTIKTGEMPEI